MIKESSVQGVEETFKEWLKRDHGTRMSKEESGDERNQGAGRLENAK